MHVPYKGNVPAITDLLAGQTQLIFATMPTVLPHAKAGKLRAIATIGNARSAAAPDLPTVAETLSGFEVTNWIGLLAPANTPQEIVKKLNAEVQATMLSKDIQSRLPNEGARFVPTTPESFGAFTKAEIAKWAPVVATVTVATQVLAQSPNWVIVAESEKTIYYIDTASMRALGDEITLWEMQDQKQPNWNKIVRKESRSVMLRTTVNCRHDTLTTWSYTEYAGSMGYGEVIDSHTSRNPTTRNAPPGTVAAQFVSAICRR